MILSMMVVIRPCYNLICPLLIMSVIALRCYNLNWREMIRLNSQRNVGLQLTHHEQCNAPRRLEHRHSNGFDAYESQRSHNNNRSLRTLTSQYNNRDRSKDLHRVDSQRVISQAYNPEAAQANKVK